VAVSAGAARERGPTSTRTRGRTTRQPGSSARRSGSARTPSVARGSTPAPPRCSAPRPQQDVALSEVVGDREDRGGVGIAKIAPMIPPQPCRG
jgi:hypothetical protein